MHLIWRREDLSAPSYRWRSGASLGRRVVAQSARKDQTMIHDRRVVQSLHHAEQARSHEGLREEWSGSSHLHERGEGLLG